MSDLFHPSLFILPLFFFMSMAAEGSNNSSYPDCPSYQCGNVNIAYPFWRTDTETTTRFCAYQGFGINCFFDGVQNISNISLGGDSYYVKSIDYVSRSMALVDYDISPVVPLNNCPRVRHNISLETLPLNFSTLSVNLSFHFNCSGIPPFAAEIGCLGYNEKKSCVHIVRSDREETDWAVYSCEEEVVTTAFNYYIDNIPNLSTEYGVALRQGFELNWGRMDDCDKCEESDGRCGHRNATEFICFCSDGTTSKDHCKGRKVNWKFKLVIGVVPALILIFLIIIICYNIKFSWSNCVASFKHQTEDDKNVEAFVEHHGSLSTKRYKYVDIKKMTNSFQVKLGQGGFGSVFKGKLSDGRLVAVKVLNSSKANGQEFMNEVASIGRTSHVNIVILLGFCFEYKKRALVYEFMPNGSLEKFIYSHASLNTSSHIGVNKLYEIALGIARGLDYLHRGCNTRILHLDIKPHNILLDEDFCPKIADFGLAKLYSRKQSIVSMLEARGTIGYIAPEVFNRNFGGVSHKSDVYSYGMLILEMVGGRKSVDACVGSGRTSEIYFPYWIYNRLEKEDFLLDGITSIEENEYARKMTIVGLWCIQADPNQRPYIIEVIEMLEGSVQALEIPPKPFFSSPLRSPATSESVPEII